MRRTTVRRSASLQEIPSSKYFENLDISEMKAILKKSIETDDDIEREKLQFILTLLWNSAKEKNRSSSRPTSQSMRPTTQHSRRRPGSQLHQELFLRSSGQMDTSVPRARHDPHRQSNSSSNSSRRVRFSESSETGQSSTSFQDNLEKHLFLKKATSLQNILGSGTEGVEVINPLLKGRSAPVNQAGDADSLNIERLMKQLKEELRLSRRVPSALMSK